ncbi:hypothetical protein ACIPMU_36700 [Streptomyces cyaneofuscatus]|uniref:hypothetical protein n=1 Tax=Streptomyces cyaneofuscatus TaxID=66883 RepID=UPI00381E9CDD
MGSSAVRRVTGDGTDGVGAADSESRAAASPSWCVGTSASTPRDNVGTYTLLAGATRTVTLDFVLQGLITAGSQLLLESVTGQGDTPSRTAQREQAV